MSCQDQGVYGLVSTAKSFLCVNLTNCRYNNRIHFRLIPVMSEMSYRHLPSTMKGVVVANNISKYFTIEIGRDLLFPLKHF